MVDKTPQPKDVKRALKEKIAELNSLLQTASTIGVRVVIKPDNGTAAPNKDISATKSILAITYPS